MFTWYFPSHEKLLEHGASSRTVQIIREYHAITESHWDVLIFTNPKIYPILLYCNYGLFLSTSKLIIIQLHHD